MNMTMPTTRLPPATKFPNVSIIVPALPRRRINLVDAMLRERRKSVVTSSNDGKVDNSTGSFVARTIIRIDIAREMLQDRPISSRNVGRGINNVARIATRPAAKIILLWVASLDTRDFEVLGVLL
jgi:hypothetical protein